MFGAISSCDKHMVSWLTTVYRIDVYSDLTQISAEGNGTSGYK
jgi:hypothetical protein